MAGGPGGAQAVTGTAAALAMRRRQVIRRRPRVEDLAAHVVGATILVALVVSAARAMAFDETAASSAVSLRLAIVIAGAAVTSGLVAAVTSGSRGGPLALASPLVVLVLLGPVDRGAVLRLAAARQVAVAAIAGSLVGGVSWVAAALLGSPRQGPVWWVVAGATTGVLCAGVALLVAGLRTSGRASAIAQAALLAWWLGDAILDTATSPMASLARVPFAAPGVAGVGYVVSVALGVAVVGVRRIGGLSVEQAWRRSGTADQLRVAVGLNDLRTALLILRRRAKESPRSRPWLPTRGRWTRRHPIAARSVRALLRWPARRALRFVLLAAVAGVVAVASAGVPAIGVVAALVAFAAALDAVDALAQELDHPDLQRGYPIAEASLAARHTAVPLVTMTGFCIVATGAAALVSGRLDVLVTGTVASPMIAVAALAGATLTATRTARPFTSHADIGLPPEIVASRIIARVVAPVVPLALTIVPLVASLPSTGATAVTRALPGAAVSVVLLVVLCNRSRLERLWRRLGARVTALARP